LDLLSSENKSIASPLTLSDRWPDYFRLMRFDRPIGIFLLLWPTLWALWIASKGHPDWYVFVVFVVGVVLMRSAGCVINDYADRDIDPYVMRSQNRPIVCGRVSPKEALILFFVLCLVAFFLVLTLNTLTVMMSFVAVFFAVTYPFMKRYTYFPQIYLGMAFGWAIPMAFAAQTGEIPRVAWLLFIANILWSTAYDTMYAMIDRVYDVRIGVKSTAILFGESDRFIVGIIQIMMIAVLFIVGMQINLGIFYYIALCGAAALFLYQQYMIRHRDALRCMQAFKNNNWLGAIIFLGIFLHYFLGASD